jgi:Arm DNA-binding domain
MALTAKRIARLLRKSPGRHHDGHGLYLQVVNANSASWILRYVRHGKERMLGLGPVHIVGLAEARLRALDRAGPSPGDPDRGQPSGSPRPPARTLKEAIWGEGQYQTAT